MSLPKIASSGILLHFVAWFLASILVFRLFLFLYSLISLTHSLEINREHEIDFGPHRKKREVNTNEHAYMDSFLGLC